MDPMVYIIVAVIITVLLGALTFFRRSQASGDGEEVAVAARPRPAAARIGDAGPAGAGRRRVRQRLRPRQDEDDSDEEPSDALDDIAMPDGKVGAKKMAKLQAKADKRANREAELHEREERKKREEQRDAQRQKEDQRQEQIDKQMEEEEKKRKEEEERREHEEYLKLKAAFTVDEEGTHEAELNQDENSLLAEFINYVKDMKVIMLEDLAAHFKIRTQDAIDRITDLLKDGQLQGVLDDRGKFIYITRPELEAVAKFINQRGRVSITELAESSNQLINLNPDNKDTLEKLVGADAVKVS